MRILHCSDIHIDSKMESNLSREKARQRKSEILSLFTKMLDYAEKNHIQAVIIAGDLFDRKNVSATAKNTVMKSIINHSGMVFFYLPGNHDEESVFDSENLPDNLFMFNSKWNNYILGEKGRICISGIVLGEDNKDTLYDDLSLNEDCFNIVTMHGMISEYMSDSENINMKRLRGKGIDYLALGHIHQFKMDTLDPRGKYCYSGCLEGRGFDEAGEHGFVVIDVDEESMKCAVSFVPFARRKVFVLDTDISECDSSLEIVERVIKEKVEKEINEEDLVKVVLTGEINVGCEKNIDFIKKQLEDEFFFVKVKDESTYFVDFNSYINDKSLKGEFVRTVMKQCDISESDKAEIIRYGIMALSEGK